VQAIQSMQSSKFMPLTPWLLALLVVALFAGFAAGADESKTAAGDQKAEDEPILIEADQLISNNEEKWAEFIGNVKVTQADMVIDSDKLRIYYRGELLEGEKESGENEDTLEKIVASGNVKINTPQYTAVSDVVEYDAKSLTITMTGDNSKVISDKNSISGSKIILYRQDNRIKVLGNQKKRVEATFYSGGSGSNPFKLDNSKE